jgi:hypothetical protein
MVRRGGTLLEGMWEPPGVELSDGARPAAALARMLAARGVRTKLERTGRVVRHTITHHSIEVEVWRGVVEEVSPRSGDARYVDPRRPGVPLTGLARRLLQRTREGRRGQ